MCKLKKEIKRGTTGDEGKKRNSTETQEKKKKEKQMYKFGG